MSYLGYCGGRRQGITFARGLGTVLRVQPLSGYAPAGFSFERLSGKSLGDKDRPIAPSLHLIVPDVRGGFGQPARMLL